MLTECYPTDPFRPFRMLGEAITLASLPQHKKRLTYVPGCIIGFMNGENDIPCSSDYVHLIRKELTLLIPIGPPTGGNLPLQLFVSSETTQMGGRTNSD
jgi:hypothetical protein